MPEGTDDRQPPAEEEVTLARAALSRGELQRAAEHVANAIAAAPTMPEAHQLLAQLAAHRQATGAELYPLDGPVSVGSVVARAHLLASSGEYDEALELLAAATAHAPTADWAGVPWLTDPDLPSRLAPDLLARTVATVCGNPLAEPLPEDQRAPLRPYLLLARHAARAHPTHAVLLGAASTLARRLGESALAIEWARQAAQIQPAKVTEVGLGYAYRDAGRISDALDAFQRALAYEPGDLSVYADIANALADDGRLDEALGWADRAVAMDPTDHCAVHTAYRLRFRRDGAVAHLIGLADFAREYPTGAHEHTELADSCAGRAWLGQVAPAGGTAAHLVRRLLEQGDPPSDGQLTLDLLEPPSAMNTLLRAFPAMELRVQRLLPPDIRTPRRAVGLRVWTFEGTTGVAAVPPPSAAGASALVDIAQPVWPHPLAAYDRSIRLAAVPAADLVGALVHPPAPPQTGAGQALARHDPARWVRTVQVWACLGLLHHGADEPWGPSTRRRMLVDLTFGVEDWITEAAMFAMITAAWVDRAARSDVAALVRERLADVAEVAAHRPVTIAWSLARLALMTPDLAPDATRLAWQIVAAEEVEDEVSAPPAPGRVRRLFASRRPKG